MYAERSSGLDEDAEVVNGIDCWDLDAKLREKSGFAICSSWDRKVVVDTGVGAAGVDAGGLTFELDEGPMIRLKSGVFICS